MSQDQDVCSVCTGTGSPYEGGLCICGGEGTADAEMQGLRQHGFDLEDELDKIRSILSQRIGYVHGESAVTTAQRASRELLHSRGNYAGACEDLKEIRRVVGAGTGSNVSSVTACWGAMETMVDSLSNELDEVEAVIAETELSLGRTLGGTDEPSLGEKVQSLALTLACCEERLQSFSVNTGGEIDDLEAMVRHGGERAEHAAKRLGILARTAWQAVLERTEAIEALAEKEQESSVTTKAEDA